MVRAGDVDRGAASPSFVDRARGRGRRSRPWRRELVERALAPDLTYQRAGAVLRAAYDPPFFATYFYGLDVVGHAFYRFAQPEALRRRAARGAPPLRRACSSATRRCSASWVGELGAGACGPATSCWWSPATACEPAPLWRRLLRRAERRPRRAAAPTPARRRRLPAGRGDGDPAGRRARGRLGPGRGAHDPLPDGPARGPRHGGPGAHRDAASRAFARAHPVTFIPSYESLAVAPGRGLRLPPLPDEP